MLRSLGLFLLLATASLAQTDTFYDFTVLYSTHSCEESVNTLIRTQIHQSVVDTAGQSFDKPVYGHDEVRRNLRTGSSPRELQVNCNSPCGCAQYSACRIQTYFCADTCGGDTDCTCARRLEDDEPRLLQIGDQCDKHWNQENLNYAEMDSNLESCPVRPPRISKQLWQKYLQKKIIAWATAINSKLR